MKTNDRAPGTDMWSPVRYVATMLEDARLEGRAVPLDELAAGYEHAVSGDISRFRQYSGADNDEDMKRWIIAEAIRRLGSNVAVDGAGLYSLTRPMANVRYERQKLVPLRPPSAAQKRLYALRKSIGPLDDLVTSMKEEGWNEDLGVAIRDKETGIILSGNRRVAAAKKAGVEPRIVERRFAGDFERLRFAINANAEKPLTKDERDEAIRDLKAVAPELSIREIAEILGVPRSTVHRAGETVPFGTQREKSHKPSRPVPESSISPEQAQEIAHRRLDKGETLDKIGKEVLGVSQGHRSNEVIRAVAQEEGRREVKAGVAPPPHCPTCTC